MSKAAYIFSDVDFVLNSRRTLVAYGDYMPSSLDPVALEMLQVLAYSVEKAGFEPRIIISSSWRIAHPHVAFWQGLVSGYVRGITPDLGDTKERGDECEAYLDSVFDVYAPWVALDDLSIGSKHSDKWVPVDGNIGLSFNDVDRAFYLLTGKTLLPQGFEEMGKWKGMREWRRMRGINAKSTPAS